MKQFNEEDIKLAMLYLCEHIIRLAENGESFRPDHDYITQISREFIESREFLTDMNTIIMN